MQIIPSTGLNKIQAVKTRKEYITLELGNLLFLLMLSILITVVRSVPIVNQHNAMALFFVHDHQVLRLDIVVRPSALVQDL